MGNQFDEIKEVLQNVNINICLMGTGKKMYNG